MIITKSAEEKKLVSELCIGKENETVKNEFSGETVLLSPEAVALYDFIKGAEYLEDADNLTHGLAIFSRNWPDEYMKLLD